MINRHDDILRGEPLRSPIEEYSSVRTLRERVANDATEVLVIGGVLVAAAVVLGPTIAKDYGIKAYERGKRLLTTFNNQKKGRR